MKTLLLALTLLVSTQSFAEEREQEMFSTMTGVAVSLSPLITIGSPFILSAQVSKLSGMDLKVAALIIKDGQEYIQTGEINLFLASKVSLIQQENLEMSEAEAIDVLLEVAEQFINNH